MSKLFHARSLCAFYEKPQLHIFIHHEACPEHSRRDAKVTKKNQGKNFVIFVSSWLLINYIAPTFNFAL